MNEFQRLCEECKIPAAVGWGNPPVWLCDAHFDEWLAGKSGVLFDRTVRWVCVGLDGSEVIVQADYGHEVR